MKHLAVIMDGNGRYGLLREGDRSSGYQAGAEAFVRLLSDFAEFPFPFLTVYAFSTENNKRNSQEVSNIFHIIAYFLKKKVYPIAKEKGIGIRFIGNLEGLSAGMRIVLSEAPSANQDKNVLIALNYGGMDEIVRSAQKTLARGEAITAQTLKKNSDLTFVPDPDAIVRYGGYKRISNFLLMHCAYSELFFLDKLWPEYETKDITDVLGKYEKIKRNFGESC